jgi:hypothetical protein
MRVAQLFGKRSTRVKVTPRRVIDLETRRTFQDLLGINPVQVSRREAKALEAYMPTRLGQKRKPEQLRTTRFPVLNPKTNPRVGAWAAKSTQNVPPEERVTPKTKVGWRSRHKLEEYVVAKKATRKRVV